MEKPFSKQTGSISIKEKQKKAMELWDNCILCPRFCRVNRSSKEKGQCGANNRIALASYGPHFGEENPLTGFRGSGAIFFMHCNLECVFCQNWTISRGIEKGEEISTSELSSIMLQLQERGCHNINLVTPTPYIPLILDALAEAVEKGLSIPLVYNCGGYENPSTLKLLEGIVDIYLPDAKYFDQVIAQQYSGVNDYPQYLQKSLKEMHRQVGDLKIDQRGIAYRGLLVRHLVLPNSLAGTPNLTTMLSREVSPSCAINVMDQYYPAYQAKKYTDLSRTLSHKEFRQAIESVQKEGLRIIN